MHNLSFKVGEAIIHGTGRQMQQGSSSHRGLQSQLGDVVTESNQLMTDLANENIGLCHQKRVMLPIHLHLAISRIHPLSLNNVEPYRDFQKLQSMSVELERKHNLQKIERSSQVPATPIVEVRQAMQSFEGWLKEKVKGPLADALAAGPDSWEAIHKCLARFDVELRERGAGLVLSHRKAKIFVPASRVHRNFGKLCLEGLLGPFAPSKGHYPCEISYKLRPLLKTDAAMSLFDSYSQEKEGRKIMQKTELDIYRARSSKEYQELIRNHRKLCLELRLDRIIYPARKREVFAKYSSDLQKQVSVLRDKRKGEREAIFKKSRTPYWEAWLQQKAQAGSEAALSTLRDTRKRRELEGNFIEIQGPRIDRLDMVYPRTVALDGSVRYALPNAMSVTDFGHRIRVEGHREEDIKAALTFAQRHLGGARLSFKGDLHFISQAKSLSAPVRGNKREEPKGFDR